MQLEIECEDGKALIYTDEDFDWTNGGAIRFADNKDGEIYDARCIPTYNCKAKLSKCAVLPSASNNVSIKEHERFSGKLIITPKGKRVIDFGQNIAGYVCLSFDSHLGAKLYLSFGEMLDADGEFTQSNIQLKNEKKGFVTPKQKIIYTAKEGKNEYKTSFAIFGFRYALVEGDVELMPDEITAIAVYSDMQSTLEFDSSHPLINKFVENTRWSAKNNHADLPTDCPTRERHGWTGDAQIFANTAGYFFDYSAFARKYVRMLGDDQKKNGKILQIVPYGGVDFYMSPMNGCAGWSDAEIIIPYRMWKLYGDDGILRENLTKMKKYADYTVSKIHKWYPTSLPTGAVGRGKKYVINYGQAYGEWAEPADVKAMHWTDFITTKPEVSTAYASYVLSLIAEICDHLGDGSAEKYRSFSAKIREGYISLIKGKKYSLDTDRQARLVRPLYFNLLDSEDAEYAKDRLIKALDNYGWRVGTGFLSTPLILFVLGDINIEYAYRLLENEEMPGWLYMPKHGATTIWEAWEGNSTPSKGIASLNHYSKGAVCEWIFTEMCGVRVKGEREFLLEPKVGGTLTYAGLKYDSVYGRVECSWKRENGSTTYTVSIPSNTTATLVLPDGERKLGAGRYEFKI
jgi:alpha-L-rhamnosidase